MSERLILLAVIASFFASCGVRLGWGAGGALAGCAAQSRVAYELRGEPYPGTRQ